jgi:hypothetical protein
MLPSWANARDIFDLHYINEICHESTMRDKFKNNYVFIKRRDFCEVMSPISRNISYCFRNLESTDKIDFDRNIVQCAEDNNVVKSFVLIKSKSYVLKNLRFSKIRYILEFFSVNENCSIKVDGVLDIKSKELMYTIYNVVIPNFCKKV